jgi:hypothetical protein
MVIFQFVSICVYISSLFIQFLSLYTYDFVSCLHDAVTNGVPEDV